VLLHMVLGQYISQNNQDATNCNNHLKTVAYLL